MIVKDQEKTLDHADELSNQILIFINNDMKKFIEDSDPVEQIYLVTHIIGFLFAKTCVALQGFAGIYDIDLITIDKIKEIIISITDENIKLNKDYCV
jgi:hypothetical protein